MCFSVSVDKSNRKAGIVISNCLGKKGIESLNAKHSESVQNKAFKELLILF